MQILEAALAFAITMLVLSLTCSSIVEIIHRIFSMREAGLQYMLGQMFDQVLVKYIKPELVDKLKAAGLTPEDRTLVANELEAARKNFMERMSSNRAPMGVTPKATPTDPTAPKLSSNVSSWASKISLWSGRDLTSLTPAEFMERLAPSMAARW